MATIKKSITITTVEYVRSTPKGLLDGTALLIGKFDIDKAQKILRKENANILVKTVTTQTRLAVMDLETFMQYASFPNEVPQPEPANAPQNTVKKEGK